MAQTTTHKIAQTARLRCCITLSVRDFEHFVAAIQEEPELPSVKLLAAVAAYKAHQAMPEGSK